MSEVGEGPDAKVRCRWCLHDPAMLAYHDREWGFPVADDQLLFETLTLESFQSGLSWRVILAKREGFRAAFAGFDTGRIAAFNEADVVRLLADPAIVRHRGKIVATVNNARRVEVARADGGSFAATVWRFAPVRAGAVRSAAPTPEAHGLSRELRRQGWMFVGPTTVHAFMQAAGLIDGHATACAIRPAAEQARDAFTPPS